MYWLLMILHILATTADVGLLVSINHLLWEVVIIHVTLILLAVIYTSSGEVL